MEPYDFDEDERQNVQGAVFAGVLKAGLVLLAVWFLLRLVL